MNNINQQINKLKLILILSLMNKENQEETNDITQLLLLCIEAITQIDTEEGETQTTQIEGVEATANNYKSNSNDNSKKSSDEENNRNLCPSVLICENLCYDNAIDGGNRPVSVTIGATFSLMKETFMENYSPDFSRANAQLALMAQPTNGGYFTFKSEKDIIAENLRNHRGLYYSDNRGAAERESPSSNQGDGDEYAFGGGNGSWVYLEKSDLTWQEKSLLSVLFIGKSSPITKNDFKKVSSDWSNRDANYQWRLNNKLPPHEGIDIVGKVGENDINIYSVAFGKVKSIVYNNKYYGNYVIVDHAFGMTTKYAHLKNDSIKVKEGSFVTSFTKLGIEGNTNGWNPRMGDHLHFQLMIRNTYTNMVDPKIILPNWIK